MITSQVPSLVAGHSTVLDCPEVSDMVCSSSCEISVASTVNFTLNSPLTVSVFLMVILTMNSGSDVVVLELPMPPISAVHEGWVPLRFTHPNALLVVLPIIN